MTALKIRNKKLHEHKLAHRLICSPEAPIKSKHFQYQTRQRGSFSSHKFCLEELIQVSMPFGLLVIVQGILTLLPDHLHMLIHQLLEGWGLIHEPAMGALREKS